MTQGRARPSALTGRTVVVLRGKAEGAPLVNRLRALGARVFHSPAIRTKPIPLDKKGRGYLKNIGDFDGVLLTSARAVNRWSALWRQVNGAGTVPGPKRTVFYAVGPQTAAAARGAGLKIKRPSKNYSAEGLAQLLAPQVKGKRFLFPRAREGRDVLIKTLARAGARVVLWPVYETFPVSPTATARRALGTGNVDAVLFTSPSTVRSFLSVFPLPTRRQIFQRTHALSIGPATTDALRALGLNSVIQSPQSTTAAMVAALKKNDLIFCTRGRRFN